MTGAFRQPNAKGRSGGPFALPQQERGQAQRVRFRSVDLNPDGMTTNHPHSNITPGHVRAFQAVRSQLYDNITLAGCTIDGTPGVAIVMVDFVAEDKVAVMPLFVAITETMKLEFGDEVDEGGEDGGGPSRAETLRHFVRNKEAVTS
jgi:hypothetical protein